MTHKKAERESKKERSKKIKKRYLIAEKEENEEVEVYKDFKSGTNR